MMAAPSGSDAQIGAAQCTIYIYNVGRSSVTNGWTKDTFRAIRKIWMASTKTASAQNGTCGRPIQRPSIDHAPNNYGYQKRSVPAGGTDPDWERKTLNARWRRSVPSWDPLPQCWYYPVPCFSHRSLSASKWSALFSAQNSSAFPWDNLWRPNRIANRGVWLSHCQMTYQVRNAQSLNFGSKKTAKGETQR